MDSHYRAASEAMIRVAAATEVEMLHEAKRGPLAHALLQSRRDAIEAMVGLAKVNPADPEQIRKLQNEIERFLDLCRFVQGIFQASDQAEQELTEDDRQELRAIHDDAQHQAGE